MDEFVKRVASTRGVAVLGCVVHELFLCRHDERLEFACEFRDFVLDIFPFEIGHVAMELMLEDSYFVRDVLCLSEGLTGEGSGVSVGK